MTRASGGVAAPAQKRFDLGIFERMEGDDSEPPAWHQQPLSRGKATIQLAELVVHRDAQRLKGPRRRVKAVLALRDGRADDFGQFASGGKRMAMLRCGHRAGDTAGEAFLPQA